jgi:two-component sensor histidine kinase
VLQQLIDICTSDPVLRWIAIGSDTAIAEAYFAIPLTMALVLRDRRDDIPYPWLWALFVAFIVACGMTHLVHVWSALLGVHYLGVQAAIGLITAVASVGTAIAFGMILPQIKNLPSPRKQRVWLEQAVATRTAEKDRLIRELNHRVGNQLQILSSLLRIERRSADSDEAIAVLDRLADELEVMNQRHLAHSIVDYLGPSIVDDNLPQRG